MMNISEKLITFPVSNTARLRLMRNIAKNKIDQIIKHQTSDSNLIQLQINPDIIDFFNAAGEDYEQEINDILISYIQAFSNH